MSNTCDGVLNDSICDEKSNQLDSGIDMNKNVLRAKYDVVKCTKEPDESSDDGMDI